MFKASKGINLELPEIIKLTNDISPTILSICAVLGLCTYSHWSTKVKYVKEHEVAVKILLLTIQFQEAYDTIASCNHILGPSNTSQKETPEQFLSRQYSDVMTAFASDLKGINEAKTMAQIYFPNAEKEIENLRKSYKEFISKLENYIRSQSKDKPNNPDNFLKLIEEKKIEREEIVQEIKNILEPHIHLLKTKEGLEKI